MRAGVALVTVERVLRRRRGADFPTTIVSGKQEPPRIQRPAVVEPWPDRNGVAWAFEDARKQRV